MQLSRRITLTTIPILTIFFLAIPALAQEQAPAESVETVPRADLTEAAPPPAGNDESVFETWWFWTTVAVVVGAAAGVAAYMLVPGDGRTLTIDADLPAGR